LTSRITENNLKSALINVDKLLISSLPDDKHIIHNFSPSFEGKMKKLILRSKRMEKNLSSRYRRIIAITAIVIVLATVTLSIPNVRAAISEFIIEVYDKYSHIFFENDNYDDNNHSEEFISYAPTFIPDGFEVTFENYDDSVLIEYENQLGDQMISYIQQYKDDLSAYINTEGVQLEEIIVNGFSAYYYSNKGTQNLLWYDDHYYYRLSSTLDKEMLVKIAESIEVKIE